MRSILKFKALFLTVLQVAWTMAWCSLGIVVRLLRMFRLLDYVIWTWARTSLMILGVGLKVEGKENLPEGGAIYIFNHTSFLDIMLIFSSVFKRVRFGAKEELFKIPVFGDFLRIADFIPIARGRREEVLSLYKKAQARIAAGEGFILAPEGSRQTKEVVGTFKTGPIVFAMEAKAPIVPVIVCGAQKLFPARTFAVNKDAWYSTVRVRICPPIDLSEYGFDRRKEAAKMLRDHMQQELEKMQAEK